jgi:hypothetical protein
LVKVSPEDFKTNLLSRQQPQAVVIADIGFSEFVGNNSGWFSLEVYATGSIHILNKNAYDVADFEIHLIL